MPACPLAAGTQFATDGVLSPFFPGIAGAKDGNGNVTAGTSNLNSGGDGAYNPYGTLFNGFHQGTLFGRFSYELADNVSFYLQGQGAEAYSFGWYFPQKIQPGAGQADLFYKNNPFLSPTVQAQLGNDGTNPLQNPRLNPAVQPSNTFQLGEFLVGNGQTEMNATGEALDLPVKRYLATGHIPWPVNGNGVAPGFLFQFDASNQAGSATANIRVNFVRMTRGLMI